MTYQLITDFAAGLDARKSALTAPAGTLLRLTNAIVTPGGEIAKRRAFVNIGTLPSNSFGLAATESTVYVFGRDADVTGSLPAFSVPNVLLAAQEIPNPASDLTLVDWDVFDGKIYIACSQPSAGTAALKNPHYYDGNPVSEGNGKGFYVRTFQSKMYAINGRKLFFSAVNNPMVWDDDNNTDMVAATKLEHRNPARITVGAGDISEFSNGMVVLVAGAAGTGMTVANGYHGISNVQTGAGSPPNTFTLNGVNTSSGTADQTSGVTVTPAIYISSIDGNPCVCTVSAGDIAKFTSGMVVNIFIPPGAIGVGSVPGKHIISDVDATAHTFTLAGINVNTAETPYTSGAWCTLSTDVNREGRGDLIPAIIDADSERLISLEVYYDKLAIFSTEAVQVWTVDPDPLKYNIMQVLRGVGTAAARSPLQYGNGDVLFLDYSGVRSLKAKDSSNSASVSDIGSPIDSLLAQLRIDLGNGFMSGAISLLEPYVGRFWLVLYDRVYVLSYFPGPKITAWSYFTLPFTATYAVTCGGRVFFRDNANHLWVYGGNAGTTYGDAASTVEVRLPYLDGKKPGHRKQFLGFDATLTGTWEARVSYDYNNPDNEESLGTFATPTWIDGRAELVGVNSHFSLRFYNNDSSPATISNCAVHYEVADAEA